MSIHIYRPQMTAMKRKRVYCSNCKKMTLSLFKFYEWYDAVQAAIRDGKPVPKAELAVLISRYVRVRRLGVSLSPWLATMLRVRE